FYRIEMADIVDQRPIARWVAGHRHTVPRQTAGGRGEQGSQQAQQARFAAAVGAAQDQRATGRETAIEPLEHQPLAAATGEGLAGEISRGREGQRTRSKKAAPEGENRSRKANGPRCRRKR